MGETGYSRRNPGLAGSAKNVISPTNLVVILRQPPRFKIRVDNGRIFCGGACVSCFNRLFGAQPICRRLLFSRPTKNGKCRSRERPRNIQQPPGEGDYNLDSASFPRRSLRRLSHPGEIGATTIRTNLEFCKPGCRFSFMMF